MDIIEQEQKLKTTTSCTCNVGGTAKAPYRKDLSFSHMLAYESTRWI